jgi:hypothetical protein
MLGMAIGAGVGAVGSLISGFGNAKDAKKAAKEQKELRAKFEQQLGMSMADIETYSKEYTDFLQMLDTSFDPYEMDAAFDSLYEAVIQPMERDFSENVLPAIQQAYSGGVMGGGAGLSGAKAESVARAERGLSETKAGLRAQEREGAIQRNFQDFERRANLGGAIFGAQTAAPMFRAQSAGQLYGAGQDTISASLAANQARNQVFGNALSTGIGGATAGASISNALQMNKYIKSKTLETK